jgi:predicted NUDIX family NTP pyrophosphohydrolase
MATQSAGLVVIRRAPHAPAGAIEVLLVHPGGPYWAAKDEGAWSIPKGEYEPDEDPLAVARREFTEELGLEPPAGDPVEVGEVRLKSGKWVRAWAIEGDLDVEDITSNTFEIEWPPRSGRLQAFPEVDRAGWFDLDAARLKVNPAQVPLLDQAVIAVAEDS